MIYLQSRTYRWTLDPIASSCLTECNVIPYTILILTIFSHRATLRVIFVHISFIHVCVCNDKMIFPKSDISRVSFVSWFQSVRPDGHILDPPWASVDRFIRIDQIREGEELVILTEIVLGIMNHKLISRDHDASPWS